MYAFRAHKTLYAVTWLTGLNFSHRSKLQKLNSGKQEVSGNNFIYIKIIIITISLVEILNLNKVRARDFYNKQEFSDF